METCNVTKDVNVSRLTNPALEAFYYAFSDFYVVIAISLCIAGVAVNALNVAVLQSPALRSSVNRMLICIAAADSILLMLNVAFILNTRRRARESRNEVDCDDIKWSYYWSSYNHIYSFLSVGLHGFSLWTAAAIGGYRCYILYEARKAARGAASRSATASTVLISLVAISVLAFSLPIYFTQSVGVTRRVIIGDRCCVGYDVVMNFNAATLYAASMWINGLVLKLLPCLLLLFFLGYLQYCLYAQSRNREKRLSTAQPQSAEQHFIPSPQRQSITLASSAREPRHSVVGRQRRNRELCVPTNNLLRAILLITMTAEIPQVVISFLAWDRDFFERVYRYIADVLDLLSILQCLTTFTLYCVTSSQFRTVFRQLWCRAASAQTSETAAIIDHTMVRPNQLAVLDNNGQKRTSVYNLTAMCDLTPEPDCL